MKELFEAHQQFEADRPLMKHSTLWYQERVGHETEEWKMEDPTLDMDAFLGEASDIFLLWSAALRSAGVSPEVMQQAILQKIEYNKLRFPADQFQEGSFDEAYKTAKEREGRPIREYDIYNSSIQNTEDPRLREY